MNGILGVLGGILSIIALIFEKRYSKDSIKKRKDSKRDKEIAKKDHMAKSKRLSDLFDRVRNKNRSSAK